VNDSLNDIRQTIVLTKYYSFDLGNYTITELILKWSKLYPHQWLPLAVTEAIYQGRLKAISIEQILHIWRKKGGVHYSFNYEFIRLVQPDSNFKLDQELNLEEILTNLPETLESPFPLAPASDSSVSENSQTNKSITSISSLSEFQPINDYSQSFQKLKSLAIHNQL
jgi:hypothetical protein